MSLMQRLKSFLHLEVPFWSSDLTEVKYAQIKSPNVPRLLYVAIYGHKNEQGGYDDIATHNRGTPKAHIFASGNPRHPKHFVHGPVRYNVQNIPHNKEIKPSGKFSTAFYL